MRDDDRKPYDVHCRDSVQGLGRILLAIVKVGGKITDTHLIDGQGYKPGYRSVELRVHLHPSRREEFEATSGVRLGEPPQFQGGLDDEPTEAVLRFLRRHSRGYSSNEIAHQLEMSGDFYRIVDVRAALSRLMDRGDVQFTEDRRFQATPRS